MHKVEMAEEIQKQVGLTTKREAVEALESVLVLIKSTLQRGEDVSIIGFGTFMVRSKGARTGRNPRTGEATMIAARRVVTFRVSRLFKAYVNGESMLARTLLSRYHNPLVSC
jgi:integration host factor subunit alpha